MFTACCFLCLSTNAMAMTSIVKDITIVIAKLFEESIDIAIAITFETSIVIAIATDFSSIANNPAHYWFQSSWQADDKTIACS
jgi:hypothetical protein